MREIVPGHLYELDCLKSDSKTKLKFYRDSQLHETWWPGPSTQEVLRACVKRVLFLDSEVHWWGNPIIVWLLRTAILLFEVRHILRRSKKADGIENLKTGKDGHIT